MTTQIFQIRQTPSKTCGNTCGKTLHCDLRTRFLIDWRLTSGAEGTFYPISQRRTSVPYPRWLGENFQVILRSQSRPSQFVLQNHGTIVH